MWQLRTYGQSSLNEAATLPCLTSSGLEFHVRPTALWPQCSMIVLQRDGSAVPRPCTSTWISTPASWAALPHSISALPICSRVFSSGTPGGSALGRTLTPRPPMSATSSTNALHVSMFLRTTSADGEWNSQTEPQPEIATPASAAFLRTSLRCSLLSDGSTPCLCVVRNSTATRPVALQT